MPRARKSRIPKGEKDLRAPDGVRVGEWTQVAVTHSCGHTVTHSYEMGTGVNPKNWAAFRCFDCQSITARKICFECGHLYLGESCILHVRNPDLKEKYQRRIALEADLVKNRSEFIEKHGDRAGTAKVNKEIAELF